MSSKDDIARKTCSFDVCSQCKNSCCQDAKPPLTLERIKIISNYLETQKIPVKQPFACKDYAFPSLDVDLTCVFNDKKTKKCLIHKVKPETCRSGPITFDINCCTKKVEWFLKTSDLCPLAGILYTDKPKFKEHFEVARTELLQLISQLDAESLRAILKIEEPQTFKIDEDDLPKEVAKKLGLI